MVTCLYYIQLIFNKFKRLEFESEVGQRITIPETLFAIVLILQRRKRDNIGHQLLQGLEPAALDGDLQPGARGGEL